METRYILPATVAASLHLIALFGFNTPIVRPPSPAEPPVAKLPPIPVDIVSPDDPIEEVPAEEPKPQKGTEVPRPGLPEPESKIGDIAMPVPPPSPQPVNVTPTILPGVFGVPDGSDGPAAERAVISFHSLDNPPRTRSQVAPNYPAEMRTAALEGEVVVAFVVDESGRVARAWVVRSTDSRFESATLRAIERWRFEPGKKNGRPVRFRMEVPVVFSLPS